MALSEIEKLERRYAENPQGLTFAPLAEVHRKNGEVQRALDLLGPGLEIHPDYIPASIVLGRCHMDLGDVPAAESAFLHVLALDGENVIALKALADISERLFRFDDAERWLHALLSVDRSNDDAREQLQRVEISRRQAEVASSAEPSSVAASPSPADLSSPPQSSSLVEAQTVRDIVHSPPPFEPPVAEPAVGWVSQSGQAGDIPPIQMEDLEPSALREDFEELAVIPLAESASLEEPVRLDGPIEPLDGLVGREVHTPDQSLGDFRVETAEDIVLESAGGSEFQMPDASQELFARGARGTRAPFEEDAPVAPSAAWAAPAAERTAPEVPESNEASALEASPLAEADSAPEAMALEPAAPELATPELAAPELAAPEATVPEATVPEATVPEATVPEAADLDPYAPPRGAPEPPAPESPWAPEPVAPEPIAATPPSDFRYHRRGEEREQAQPQPQPQAQPKRSYDVGETGGRSVAQLFQGILSARPPAQTSAAPVRQAGAAGSSAGAPTRPAADALSLSSVFGEEASETPPAVPASNQGAGSVSFDDFFSSSNPSPATRPPRAPDPKNDDLDQFHAWLQNLKR